MSDIDDNTPKPMDLHAMAEQFPAIQQALQTLTEMSADPEIRRLAAVRERALREEISAIREAERRGRAEERRVLARNLLNHGFPPEKVAELLPLSLDEIRSLNQESRP